ncbi:MAG: PEP-utilizing enzyme [Candidatus Kaiserbacteria bacterium]|nr:PEP-utilizing enzyme [Candidatus Kaiserbacteria bacterium]
MELIRDLKDIKKDDIAIAGGKGSSLGEMMRIGIPVPPGFVILSSAYEQFVREKKMLKMPKVLNESEVSEEIKGAFKKLGAKKVAVRSSATAEDSKNAAWAGQLESYLNITGKDLFKNVQKCWESLSSPRANFYRAENKLTKKKISVAVVVQKMVASEIAGVAFSVHPVTEDRNQMIIEAVFGLGEALVSGQVTPDSYVIEKKSFKLLDVQKQGKQKLSEKQIKELAKICIQIEKHFKAPQDIEWAFAKGKFYIVQSRPITTLHEKVELIDFAQKAEKQFARDYLSDTTLFCLYDSYKFAYPKYLGAKLSDVLIYKSRKHSAFYLLGKESTALEDLLEEKMKPKFVRKVIAEFSEKTREVSKILTKKKPLLKDGKKLFILNSELSPLERITFLVPHLVLEHGMKIADKKLVAYCQEARQKTEKLFYDADKFFGRQKTTVPEYITGYKENMREFIIFNNEVISDRNSIEKLKKILMTENKRVKNKKIVKGFTAYAGEAGGIVKIVLSRKDYGKVKKGDVLVAANTNPDYLPIIRKAAAIVTDEGGITSHAAIVAREFKIPCIVGTKVATKILKNGDVVEIDSRKGMVRLIKRARR